MKQLVIFTRGLSHILLGLVSAYLDQAEMAFDFPPEATQISAVASAGQKVQLLTKDQSKLAFSSAVNVARYLRSGRYDVVYVHGTNGRTMFPALMGARLAGISQVIACGHAGESEPITRVPGWSFHKATASDETLGREMFNGQAAIMPDGIISSYGLNEKLREAWRAALGITGRHVYLQVSPFKRSGQYDRTLDDFHKIHASDKNARLICVGQGPLRSEILARVEYENLSDFVTLPGDADNISSFLMAADALWMPDEGRQSAVLLSAAQAAGMPCLVGEQTDCSAKLIDDGIYPLSAVLGFQLPWEKRQQQSELALEQARQTGRTAEAIGRRLVELATP